MFKGLSGSCPQNEEVFLVFERILTAEALLVVPTISIERQRARVLEVASLVC